MKVGIITILKVDNYGADLQAFALQRKLELMGYDSCVIDYLYYKNREFISEKVSKVCFKYPFKLLLREKGLVIRDIIRRIFFYCDYKKREQAFNQFHIENTKMTRCYKSYSELYSNPPMCDVYCVGSDQVWNPGNYTSLNPFFLTFAPKGKKKISYASSFGVSNLPKVSRDYYRTMLLELHNIGVRENRGAEIVKEISDRDAEVVVDPTLLLNEDEWKSVEKSVDKMPERYLLIYELKRNDYLRQVAKLVAKQYGLQIVRLCSSVLPVEKDGSVLNITTVGPGEYIYLFRHAQFVVTNSFHGTAFSINFRKPFYSVTSRKKTNNSRQEGLLAKCGLSNRLLYDDNPLPNAESYMMDISDARASLDEMRLESENYIKKSLK